MSSFILIEAHGAYSRKKERERPSKGLVECHFCGCLQWFLCLGPRAAERHGYTKTIPLIVSNEGVFDRKCTKEEND